MSGRVSVKRKSKMDGMLSSKRSKLIVCQGTDGSIQTRKEELDAVNSDHDYIQTPPTEEEKAIPKHIADKLKVDLVTNGISLSCVVFGEISIRALVVEKVAGEYNIQPPPNNGLIDIHNLAENEQLIFMARDLSYLFDLRIPKSMTQHMNKTVTNYCQVTFQSVKVKGINNPKSISFLSVSGLFSILFTTSNISQQRLIANSLWDYWLRDSEKVLPSKLEFSIANALPVMYRRQFESESPAAQVTKPLDKLLECIDRITSGHGVKTPSYTDNLRNLLNSYRSLSVRFGEEDFSRIVKKHEELVQTLIGYEQTIANLSDYMLEATSDWLGQEFHSMKDLVQQNVENFKTENISSISTLPSAEKTCAMFPRAMVRLFEQWLSPAVNADVTAEANQEDESQTGSKAADQTPTMNTTKNCIYPFIQLLLEFANNSLISGVAHVVYTQILRDPT